METGATPSQRSVISIANLLQIYNPHEVEGKIGKLNGIEDNSLRNVYERMLNKGSGRFQVKPSGTLDMEYLYEELPNFEEPLDDIRRQVALCEDEPEGLQITPLFLLGEAGVGKTYFAQKIADLLGTSTGSISMGQMTAGWLLSGSSAQWKGAKPGKVFENLVDGDYANPVIVLDEIDKASKDAQYDPIGPLFTLLEQDTAKSFTDEFANVPINASKIIWICTANDERLIPKPILSRGNVFEIKKPTPEQVHTIAKNLYTATRRSHSWGKRFEETPGDDLLSALVGIGQRDIRKALMVGFGNAKVAKVARVMPYHLPQQKDKKPFGFLS
jgi:ATP-dependent Lon protease